MAKTILTVDGKKKLQEELHFLSTVEKTRLISELADARDRGGVAENTEYEIAKEEYEKLQSKIAKIEETLSNSTLVSKHDVDTSEVNILTTVKVLNVKINKEVSFTIVPENEIDIKQGKISPNSPIGAGLLGKKVGDVASVTTPGGVIEFKILEITV
jgi:transcription elongation factor GreA